MIAYHWSPRDRRESILRLGLLVPTRHPRLVAPVVCSEGHRNVISVNSVAMDTRIAGMWTGSLRARPCPIWRSAVSPAGTRSWPSIQIGTGSTKAGDPTIRPLK